MTTEARSDDQLAERFTAELLSAIEHERRLVETEGQGLVDELSDLVAAGGKRLRPQFCYWGHRAAGGSDTDAIVRTGASLELLHTMAMIQDDVMDGSAKRRNLPTTAATFGAAGAILVGLMGFSLADRLFRRAGHDDAAMQRALDRYDVLRFRAIAGQYLDILAAKRGDADESEARRIASLKSGSYSVADPLAIGALLATDDARYVIALERFGRPLGEAFQLRDDVISTFGDPNITGKDRDGDIREGKQSVLIAKTRALATPEQRQVLDRHLGSRDLSPADADRVREVMTASGAFDATNALIGELTTSALDALSSELLDPEAVTALRSLADVA
ncbi:MAG: polyprenyl synthetase family protein, partial [Actinomycetota bacterium]